MEYDAKEPELYGKGEYGGGGFRWFERVGLGRYRVSAASILMILPHRNALSFVAVRCSS
jgi:hypothetical protein